MYMSYCRFEGTNQELNACIGEVCEHVNEEAEYGISDREIDYFRKMVQSFVGFLQDSEILDENGEIDEEMLDDICEKMAQGYGEEEY